MKTTFLTLFLLLLSLNYLFAQDSTLNNKALVVINLNSCSFCNKATNLVLDTQIREKVRLVFSSNDGTPEQIEEFIQNNFDYKPKYSINDRIYNYVSERVKIFKNPYFVILDNSNSICNFFPIDSLNFYDDLVKCAIKSKAKKIETKNSRILKIPGHKSINSVGDYLFITSWSVTNKIFYINLGSKVLDSLYFYQDDKMIYKLLEMRNVKDINVSEVKQIFKDNQLPYEIVSFGTRPSNSNTKLYNTLYVEYLDPRKLSDTISPELLFYLFSFDPTLRNMRIRTFKYWEKNWEAGEICDDLRLDYINISEINDSLWMMGAEHIYTKDTHEKVFFYFSSTEQDKELKYNGKRFTIKTDSMYTFDGDTMNNPIRLYLYKLLPSYLVYNESPYYYNYINKKTLNIRDVSSEISWIFDVDEDKNTLHFLVEEQSMLVTYSINKKTNQIIAREVLGKNDTNGNVIFDSSGRVVYLNKKGVIISYSY
jgi:hypothetical protein